MTHSRQLVLCRPQGGLNDILCQIERVCRYAERFDRTVFVDTDGQCTRFFRDSFSNYFVSRQARLVLSPDEIRDGMDNFETFPAFVAGKVSCYRTRYDRDVKNFVDLETGHPLSFDFDKPYGERLLIHHASGGGTISIRALARMRLQPLLQRALQERIGKIGSPFAAVHIRNTDYRTEYEPLIEQIASRIHGPVFVATDNRNTIAHFKAVLGEDRVFSFAKLPAAGQPVHHIDAREDAFARNCDSILDLLMLALSKEMYLLPLMPNEFGVTYSGFSVLAANLKKSGTLLRELISVPDR